MDLEKDVEYVEEEGQIDKNKVTVYALSTCGFCRRGLNFLRENSIKFKYIYIDKLEFDTKQELKKELYETYQQRPVFPYLVMNDKEVLTGFRKELWEEKLLS